MPISLLTFLIMHLLPLGGALVLFWSTLQRVRPEPWPIREKALRLFFQLVFCGVALVWAADGYARLAPPDLALVNRALAFGLPALVILAAARPAAHWATRINPRWFPQRFELAYALVGWVAGALLLGWGLLGFLNSG